MTPVGDFKIDNGKNITAQNITASTITQLAGTGTTALGSLSTSAVGGISLLGANFTLSGNIITMAAGPVAISNSGLLTLAAGSSTSISSSFSQTGGGSTSLLGTLRTTGGAITFDNPVNLAGTSSITNSSGSGNLSFNSRLNGTQNLTLTAGTGNVLFGSSVGDTNRLNALTIQSGANITYQTVNAASVTQQASSGTTISGSMNTSGASGISLTGGVINQNGTLTTTNNGPIVIANGLGFTQGASINADGGFSQTGAGTVSLNGSLATLSDLIDILSPITLAGPATLTTGGSGPGDIHLRGTVNGSNNLTLAAGTGTINLDSAIGGIARIGILTLNSAGNLNAAPITASAITQVSGTGTTTFNGALDTNSSSGISLVGTGFAINNTVHTTTGSTGANLTVTNSGPFSLGSGANLTLAGQLIQNGAGASSIQGSIDTGGSVSFQSAVTVPAFISYDSKRWNRIDSRARRRLHHPIGRVCLKHLQRKSNSQRIGRNLHQWNGSRICRQCDRLFGASRNCQYRPLDNLIDQNPLFGRSV